MTDRAVLFGECFEIWRLNGGYIGGSATRYSISKCNDTPVARLFATSRRVRFDGCGEDAKKKKKREKHETIARCAVMLTRCPSHHCAPPPRHFATPMIARTFVDFRRTPRQLRGLKFRGIFTCNLIHCTYRSSYNASERQHVRESITDWYSNRYEIHPEIIACILGGPSASD